MGEMVEDEWEYLWKATEKKKVKQNKTNVSLNTLKITNLHDYVTSDDLREIFATQGTILQAFITFDVEGGSTGEGTVVFAKSSEARTAMKALNGANIEEKEITIVLNSVARIRDMVKEQPVVEDSAEEVEVPLRVRKRRLK